MPSVDADLIESAFLAELRRNGATNAMVREVQRVIRDDVLPDVAQALNRLPYDTLTATDMRLLSLRDEISQAMGWGRVTDTLNGGLTSMTQAEALSSAAELSDALPFNWISQLPSPELLNQVVFEKPFNGQIMSQWFGQLEKGAQDNMYEAFRIGMIEGKSIPQMTKDLLVRSYDSFSGGSVNKVFANAEATARTAANIASTNTRIVFAEENSDVISGVEYIATLDDRTSMICMSLHGTVYPVDDIGPVPPQHYNCRSTLGYITKSWDELGFEGGREVEFKQRFREEGASRMDGKVVAPPDFDTWLKTQSPERQDRLLGPVRAELWRSGKVQKISGFVAANGSTTPLTGLGVNRAGTPLSQTNEITTKGGQPGFRKKSPAQIRREQEGITGPTPAQKAAEKKAAERKAERERKAAEAAAEKKRQERNRKRRERRQKKKAAEAGTGTSRGKLPPITGDPGNTKVSIADALQGMPAKHQKGIKSYTWVPDDNATMKRMRKQVRDQGLGDNAEILGVYNRKTKKILFNRDIMSGVPAPEQARTVIHEAAHNAMENIPRKQLNTWRDYSYGRLFDDLPVRGNWVTGYAKEGGYAEHFAEAYSYYLESPGSRARLKKREPMAFRLMKWIIDGGKAPKVPKW